MNRHARGIAGLFTVIVLLTGIGVAGAQRTFASIRLANEPQTAGGRLPIQGEGGIGASQTDFSNDLIQVLPRDAIQSLDTPPVASAESDSADILGPDDEVIGVDIEGQPRAYPLRILSRHEIVNDRLGNVPVAVTFCPLCYSGVVYDRRVAGQERIFGVSGILLNSDLVLFDRQRDNLWAQVTGEAISGPESGTMLTRVEFVQTSWADWSAAYPTTTVIDIMSLGGVQKYPSERFNDYYSSNQAGLVPIHGREDIDPKSLVIGVQLGRNMFAWPLESLAGEVHVSADLPVPIAVVVDPSGRTGRVFQLPEDGSSTLIFDPNDQTVLFDPESSRRWSGLNGDSIGIGPDLILLDSTVSFWFAWSAFYPETALIEQS